LAEWGDRADRDELTAKARQTQSSYSSVFMPIVIRPIRCSRLSFPHPFWSLRCGFEIGRVDRFGLLFIVPGGRTGPHSGKYKFALGTTDLMFRPVGSIRAGISDIVKSTSLCRKKFYTLHLLV
jgi:hypothetical protein